MCVALYAAGRWQAVQNTRGEWLAVLERERHRIGGALPDLVLLDSTQRRWRTTPRVGGWSASPHGSRPLELDYLVAPRRPLWLGALVLGVALGVGAVLGMQYRDLQLELQRLEATAGMLGAERKPARNPKERLDAEVKAAEAVVKSLTVPWASLIEALERASTRSRATALQPDAQNRTCAIRWKRAAARRCSIMRRLNVAHPGRAHLLTHQVQADDPQRRIQFSIQAVLRDSP